MKCCIKIATVTFMLLFFSCATEKDQTVAKGVDMSDKPLAVLTCYWTFDPAVEEVELSGEGSTPILLAWGEESIDWDNMTVDRLKVAETDGNPIWFDNALWDRYQMEGCGFFDSNNDGVNDYVIQLNGTDFKYIGDDVEFTNNGETYNLSKDQEDVTVFVLLDVSESPWGKAWDEQNQEETNLIPWISAAVTDNVNAGMDKKLYFSFIEGYEYDGNSHNGVFIPNDCSWSFSTEDMEYEGNEGIDCWIDLYVGTYENFVELEKYVYDMADAGSDKIAIQTVYKNIDGEWVGSDLWVAPVDGTGL